MPVRRQVILPVAEVDFTFEPSNVIDLTQVMPDDYLFILRILSERERVTSGSSFCVVT